MHVEMKQMPELRVAALRHTGPYNKIAGAFQQLGAIGGPARLFDQPGAQMIAVYHDDPDSTPPEKLRSDAGIVIPEGTHIPPGLVEQRVPAGKYASTVHVGPYEQLERVWPEFMAKWRPAKGERDGIVSYEIYKNNPMTTPKEQLKTELYILTK